MTITLIVPKKPEKHEEWSVKIHSTSKSEEIENDINISASVKHLKTGKESKKFDIEYNVLDGSIHISSNRCLWGSVIKANLTKAESIVKACFIKPILVSVMYDVSCGTDSQTMVMNDYFGYDLFKKTIEG